MHDLPFGIDGIFVVRTLDAFVTLSVDLLTLELVHKLHVMWATFSMTVLGFQSLVFLWLGAGTRQTDRWMD